MPERVDALGVNPIAAVTCVLRDSSRTDGEDDCHQTAFSVRPDAAGLAVVADRRTISRVSSARTRR